MVVLVTKIKERAMVMITNSLSSLSNVGQIKTNLATSLNGKFLNRTDGPCWSTADWLHACPDLIMRLEVVLSAPMKAPHEISGNRGDFLRPDQTLYIVSKSSSHPRKGS
jgi:hypothetical protein